MDLIELNHKQNYNVSIIAFESTYSFYVTVQRESERRWNRLIRRLNKLKERNDLEPLDDISKGSLCIVHSNDEFHRAIVQNNGAKIALCFGIDNGKIFVIDTSIDTLYKMSPKIRNTIEFQAINCKLFDIRLPESPELAKFIYEKIISKLNCPKIKVVKAKKSRVIGDDCAFLKKYEVMLFEDEDFHTVNQKIYDLLNNRHCNTIVKKSKLVL